MAALLEAGAAVDARHHLTGSTPIEFAFHLHNDEAVLALLSFGADPSPLMAGRGRQGGDGGAGRSWEAFCAMHGDGLAAAQVAYEQRLEQQWRQAAAVSTSTAAEPAGPLPAQDCPICMTEAADFKLEVCSHSTCFGCLHTHALTEVRHGQHPRCPLCMTTAPSARAVPANGAGSSQEAAPAGRAIGSATSSNGLISHAELRLLLSAEDLLLVERRQLEQLGIRSCPHCQTGIELGPGVNLLTATCPNRACRRRLHVEDAAAEAAFRSYSRQQRYKECQQCGAHFCYTCGKDLTAVEVLTHFAVSRRCNLFS
ncbi:hypothetical protein ABPG75_000099 [Micractinium tetrahymenae]